MSRDKLIEAIEHYQRNLDRGLRDENNTKLLHCIFKLSNMPITVSHLEETGVGRTVNSMRKMDGEVGDAARELVNKWKLMVSQNQDCDETNKNESYNKSDSSSHRSSDKYKSKERYKQETKAESEERIEELARSESESDNSSSEGKSSEDNLESSNNEDDDDEEEFEEEKKRHRSESPPKRHEKPSKYKDKHESSSSSSSGKHDKYKEHNDKNKNYRDKHNESSNRHKESSSSKYKENKESNDKYSSSKHRENDHKAVSDKHKERRKEKYQSPEKDKRRSPTPEKDQSREKHHDHRYKESSKRKRDVDAEEAYSKKSKSHHRDEDKPKKEKYSESRLKEKDRKESKRDDTKHKNKEKDKKSTEEKPKVNRNASGICSESGTSFADALGMLEPSTSKGAKKLKPEKSKEKTPERQKEPSKPKTKEKSGKDRDRKSTSSSSREESTTSSRDYDKKDTKLEIVVPPPPKNDLDINISSLLPTITPNYRPMANPLYDNPLNSRNKALNDDEALSLVMSQKNQRTKVYSGNKTYWGSVPTLFELCIRVLQDNIDALEYTGGVPYAILKPVLDKATPQQLYMMEHYNPYLIDDTDEIWKFFCSKDFKSKRREELESWRDMYMRCLDEREAKLKALTENIKVSQEKSTPVRQTKLAYIDSVVKPPRDVLRKQAKNGIDKKPLITPQSRLNAIASGSSTAQVSVPNPVRASSSNSSAAVKPKKAPLMQKTLAFLKGGRFRR